MVRVAAFAAGGWPPVGARPCVAEALQRVPSKDGEIWVKVATLVGLFGLELQACRLSTFAICSCQCHRQFHSTRVVHVVLERDMCSFRKWIRCDCRAKCRVDTGPAFDFAFVILDALEIVGDSMVEAGIHDGDTVIIKRTEIADSGDIVVALIEEQEATLKTLRKEPGRIGLEPANPNYQTRYFETNAVRIQGRLTGLIRRY